MNNCHCTSVTRSDLPGVDCFFPGPPFGFDATHKILVALEGFLFAQFGPIGRLIEARTPVSLRTLLFSGIGKFDRNAFERRGGDNFAGSSILKIVLLQSDA